MRLCVLIFCFVVAVQETVGLLFSPAVLAAEQDRTGPKLLSAVVYESGATNVLAVTFDEPLISSSTTNKGNYVVTQLGTTNPVPVQGVLYSSTPRSTSLLRLATNNWHVDDLSNYYLTVNRIQDLAGNNIAPDSRIGISWPRYTNFVRTDSRWRYQPTPFVEPGLLEQPWMSCDYLEGPSWGEAHAPFRSQGVSLLSDCLAGSLNGTEIGSGPALFRTKFVCPPEYATNGLLRFEYLVQSAAIFYLNGVEVFRLHLCPPPAQLTSGSPCCVVFIAPPPCDSFGLTVTNLVAGTNCLAVAVLGCYCLPVSICSSGDITFALGVSAGRLVAGAVPAEEPAVLRIAPHSTNAVRLSWIGSGYALEAATNLASGTSAPVTIPWLEVPNMSNPYTNSTQPHPTHFFRLRK